MRILICDDEQKIAEDLKRCIEERYADKTDVTLCSSVEDFSRLSVAGNYELAFVDIVLEDGNGISAVSDICRSVTDMKIIFMTAHVRKFAEEIFLGVQPYGFIGKPIIPEKVYYYIDRLMLDIQMASGVLKTCRGKQELEIPFGEICRLESRKRKVYITCKNETVEIYDKMGDIEKMLDARFIRCHQSFIVNADFITDFSGEMLTMNDGAQINVTRKYRQSARQRYFRYKGKNVL